MQIVDFMSQVTRDRLSKIGLANYDHRATRHGFCETLRRRIIFLLPIEMPDTSDTASPRQEAAKSITSSRRSIFHRGVNFVTFALVGLLLFNFLGRYVATAEIVSNFRLQFTIIAAVWTMLLLGLRRWRLGMLLGIGSVLSAISITPLVLPQPDRSATTEIIRVVSFNVWTKNEQPELAVQRIKELDPDVVTIVEYANDWPDRLGQLHRDYPYRIVEPRWHGFGIAIFSKRPFHDTRIDWLTIGQTDNPMITTHIRLGDRRLRLAAVHVLSPTNRFRLGIRNQQLSDAAAVLCRLGNAEPGVATLVMGDFNCTPWSPFLRDLLHATGLRDSRAGLSYHASWPSSHWWMLIPIDHFFVSPEVRVHRRFVGQSAGSDHLPIVADISIGE